VLRAAWRAFGLSRAGWLAVLFCRAPDGWRFLLPRAGWLAVFLPRAGWLAVCLAACRMARGLRGASRTRAVLHALGARAFAQRPETVQMCARV
jgi:hypothetical protein